MPQVVSQAQTRERVEKYIKTAPVYAVALKKIPGTASVRSLESRLGQVDTKTARLEKLEREITALKSEIAALYQEVNDAWYDTREKCEGYLSDGEMTDLFG